MNRPWMPLYVADYRADTAHLSAAEHGAYLLLIMHYWQTGSLPTDDGPLARIGCMKPAEWRKAKPVITKFFTKDWKHKRIDTELARAAEISSKRRASAKQKHSKGDANAEQLDTHARASSPSPSLPNGRGEAPSDPKVEFFRRSRQVFGSKQGGSLGAKLLKSLGNEDDPKVIAKARARIEEASTMASPLEWIGRVMHPKRATTPDGQLFPEGII